MARPRFIAASVRSPVVSIVCCWLASADSFGAHIVQLRFDDDARAVTQSAKRDTDPDDVGYRLRSEGR